MKVLTFFQLFTTGRTWPALMSLNFGMQPVFNKPIKFAYFVHVL